MINFFTFCVFINRHNKIQLTKALLLLVKSIKKYINEYKLICYINFDINKKLFENFNIEFRKYYDRSKIKLYNNKWLNLSFNKINIYKDLYDEFKEDYTWVDLDTVISSDISYINNLSNVFIENGGDCKNKNLLFRNRPNITVPRNRYIQGNFWKINISLYNKLMICLNEIRKRKLILRYDLQDLFTFYVYKKNKGVLNNINILGNNIKSNTINGLCVWSKIGNTHATIDGFNNLYYDENILKSKFYKGKEIHILSFTFNTLKKLWNNENFNKMFL